MNLQESITYLAQVNSRKCLPKRLEDIDKTIPYFNLHKNDMGRLDIETFAYEGHDNASRMQLWEQYLKYSILPNIDPCVDITGYYNIELHDSYTYLHNEKSYKDVLCFSKFKNDADPILIPDPYMICNWGEALNALDDKEDWMKKKNKICFVGTTTGDRNPLLNERINLCLWSLDKRNICDFNITNVAQMNIADIRTKIPQFDEIYRKPLSIEDQLKYRYHLAVDGNTCKFDVWYYKAANVVLKYESKEMLWYHPLLQNEIHFIDVNKDDMLGKVNFLNNNPQQVMCLLTSARKTTQMLFRPLIHQIYTINLFESIAANK